MTQSCCFTLYVWWHVHAVALQSETTVHMITLLHTRVNPDWQFKSISHDHIDVNPDWQCETTV